MGFLSNLFRRAPVPAPAPAPPPINAVQVASALSAMSAVEPTAWSATLTPAMLRHDINTPIRAAAFLATIALETGGLRQMTENLNYSAARLVVVWPSRFTAATSHFYAGNPEKLANSVYAGRMGNGNEASGDGWKFRGRGLIQITGRDNYVRLARAFGMGLDGAAAWVSTREGAAQSAAWWWSANGCNELADAGNVAAWRRRVNGGLNGLDMVQVNYARAMEAMG